METKKRRGRPPSPLPSLEFLRGPDTGIKRDITLVKDMTTAFFEDPGLVSNGWSQCRAKKLAYAVQVLQENKNITQIDGAKNELKKYHLEPDSVEDRKLAYLLSTASLATIDYLETTRGTLGVSEANTGANFSQVWKNFFKELIINRGYDRDQSFKIFDTIFDNELVLDALAEKNRIMLVNGLEAELSVFWLLDKKNVGEVKFADRDLDEKNGVDLVLIGDKSITYLQVKSSNKINEPVQFDILDEFSLKDYRREFIDKLSNKDHRLHLESCLRRFTAYVQKEKEKDPFRTINGIMFYHPVRPEKWELRKNRQRNFQKFF